jgi:hypothetical protein
MITSEEQVDFFTSYYSYDIINFFKDLKHKYENDDLLNECDINSNDEFVELLLDNVDLKDMYLQKFK